MKRNITLIAALFTFLGCSKAPISGIIKFNPNHYYNKIYLIDPKTFSGILSPYAGAVIDSANMDIHGNFAFKNLPNHSRNEIFIIAIHKKDERFKNNLTDQIGASNYFPILLHIEDPIRITGNANDLLYNTTIKSNHKALHAINKLIAKKKELTELYLNDIDHHDEEKIIETAEKTSKYRSSLMAYADSLNDYSASILALRWSSLEGDYERMPEMVKSLWTKYNKEYSEDKYMVEIGKLISKLPISIGDKFPDFDLPTATGEIVKLNEILGSRITLIDMWASWCAPCRKENREYLVPIWEKYHPKGFQIIGYALDSDLHLWQKAIDKDGIHRWPQASHLLGDESPIFEQLKISTIPANYLVSEKGEIIAKNVYGKELEELLSKYFNQE